jgi:O-antigen ligase
MNLFMRIKVMTKVNTLFDPMSINLIGISSLILVLVILTLILLNISPYTAFIPFLYLFYLKYGDKFLLGVIIISLLTVTGSINLQIRLAVQLLSTSVLFFLFVKKYGILFSSYPKIPKEIKILLLFVLTSMLLATLLSDYFYLGIEQIIRLTIFMIIVYGAYSIIINNSTIKSLLFSLIIVGLIYCANLFIELWKSDFNFIRLNLRQMNPVSNNYINMNAIGSFLIIIISILLSFFIKIKNKEKVKWFLLIAIFYLGLFTTNSRAAILCSIISSLYIIYKLSRKTFNKIIILLFVLIPFLFINPIADILSIYFRMDKIFTGRDYILNVTSEIIKNNPVWGVGPAATKYYIYPNLPFLLGSFAEKYLNFHYNEIEFGHAHNFYLFFWSDLGLLGLITSILLPVLYFKLCKKALKKTKYINQDYYLLSLGITAAGIGLFIRGLFEWGNLISYGSIKIDLPFWCLLIMLSYIVMSKIDADDKLFFNKNLGLN